MKKIFIYLAIAGASLLASGCQDWLDVLPKNEQTAAEYWKTKEQVTESLAQGYSNMRATVPLLIKWGELRGGSIYAYAGNSMQQLQNFQLTPSSGEAKWGAFYSVLNVANSVIKFAPEVRNHDETYHEAVMNSHMAEAYFMRAWAYFTLVRNFKEVPLILEPYMTDEHSIDVPKSSEEVIIAQIKSDIKAALDSGAAKEFYDDDEWEGMSKGRVTVWALYALMADVCLWNEDYADCVKYVDLITESDATFRPAFVEDPEQWFSIFNPGNSNGSVFELNFQTTTLLQDANSPSSFYPWGKSSVNSVQYSKAMCQRLFDEAIYESNIRGLLGTFNTLSGKLTTNVNYYFIWKFQGMSMQLDAQRDNKDANWILYRMADVLLMKAEALIWQEGTANYTEALKLIDRIRTRAGVPTISKNVAPASVSQEEMLQYVLHERDMELAAEGKRWYDLMRFGKSKNYKYKDAFIEEIVENNASVTAKWIRSVLKNTYAWYLPIHQDEIERNPLLVQNPYYDVTVN
ncbi:RagB/SusD family nutrient uptake outer membrane protein [Bacteroides sp. 224]|uniref:RagB/SusD family nutrient uptake outer membrane protein n=1 Tax=Bacteroides sp. 224 TaxID=2302936 RepID=UPI0013D8DAF5|nr:RagB/SusD family nutrient uptake outer membrane protein [Bacteroides sp. 224]NDV63652.1 RagB/SusD family nutrient uptake outer membrane protein [Bacteroides sp. 224]